jgi:hypothetical protein
MKSKMLRFIALIALTLEVAPADGAKGLIGFEV